MPSDKVLVRGGWHQILVQSMVTALYEGRALGSSRGITCSIAPGAAPLRRALPHVDQTWTSQKSQGKINGHSLGSFQLKCRHHFRHALVLVDGNGCDETKLFLSNISTRSRWGVNATLAFTKKSFPRMISKLLSRTIMRLSHPSQSPNFIWTWYVMPDT